MTAPINLPPLTLLMSDHTTHSLACDVAEALSAANASLYVDDFLAPVYEGLRSMFDMDWKSDMASPTETRKLMLESIDGEATEGDILVSLEKWFNETFGEAQLGKMGLKRMKTNRDLFAYPYLFRDATPTHISSFLADSSLARRDILMVNLVTENPINILAPVLTVNYLTWATTPTVEAVIKSISETCK